MLGSLIETVSYSCFLVPQGFYSMNLSGKVQQRRIARLTELDGFCEPQYPCQLPLSGDVARFTKEGSKVETPISLATPSGRASYAVNWFEMSSGPLGAMFSNLESIV